MKHTYPKPLLHSGVHRQQMATTVSFNNRTGSTVTVVGRDGIPCCIGPCFDTMRKGIFYIYLKYEFENRVSFNSIAEAYPQYSNDRKLIMEAIEASGKSYGNKLEVVYELSAEELYEEGSLYFDLLDIVVSIQSPEQIPPHPRTQGSLISEMSAMVAEKMFSYHCVVIDHSGMFGQRFIRIGTEVYPIPTLRNSGCPDGIYIVVNHSNGKQDASHYLLYDEQCPITLYSSKEEAETSGGVDAEVERRIKKEQQELRQRELELNQRNLEYKGDFDIAKLNLEERLRVEKNNSERERAMFDETLRQKNAELEQLRKEREADTKESYESRKHEREIKATDRKTAIEWLKLVPPVITVASALITLWVKK